MFLGNSVSLALIAGGLVSACCDGMWIGYKYDAIAGQYEWQGASCVSTYEQWNDTQPDDFSGSEVYAGISYSAGGNWDDYGENERMECGCQIDLAVSCDVFEGWRNYSDGAFCFYVYDEMTNFTYCETKCTEIGAEMLCIEDSDMNLDIAALRECDICMWEDPCFNNTCCSPVWIGYDQVAITPGTWEWADGSCSSNYTNWNGANGSDVQPDLYGDNELYAVLGEWDKKGVGMWYTAPGDGWDDAWCGCQIVTEDACNTGAGFVSYNSSTFEQTCYYISNYTMSYESCTQVCGNFMADLLCISDVAQNNFLSNKVTCAPPMFFRPTCFWHDSHLREEGMWYGLGIPCIIVMFIVTVHMCLIVFTGAGGKSTGAVNMGEAQTTTGTGGSPRRIDLSVVPNPLSSAYGRLLDMPYEASESEPEIRANTEVDEMVNKWLLRGAVAEIVFAIGLGGLGATMILHNEWIAVSLYLDAIEGFVCFCCKVVIIIASYKVYQNLSPLSRKVVGPWLHVFALAKFLMGIASFNIFVGYMIFAAEDDKFYNFCLGAHFFYSALLSMIVFQTLTGVALYRIHINAVNEIGDINRFYDVVGFWWAILVFGTFVVGIATWLIGTDFMIKEDRDGFREIGIYFSIASVFQACAGAAIFCINLRARAHFAGPKGENTIQMMEKK